MSDLILKIAKAAYDDITEHTWHNEKEEVKAADSAVTHEAFQRNATEYDRLSAFEIVKDMIKERRTKELKERIKD